MKWRSIKDDPPPRGTLTDKATIWVAFGDKAGERWRGRQAPVWHEGYTASGYDMGWCIALPVGFGGIPDWWIDAWMPLPSPPEKE